MITFFTIMGIIFTALISALFLFITAFTTSSIVYNVKIKKMMECQNSEKFMEFVKQTLKSVPKEKIDESDGKVKTTFNVYGDKNDKDH